MKQKLASALGTFGIVLWYIITFLYSFFPIVILGFPFLVDAILIALMMALPLIGELLRVVLYIWATVVVFSQPIDAVSILFLLFAALYFFTTLFPLLISLFSNKND